MSDFGHGHVFPRKDGARARCGGPAICSVCARDLARKNLESASCCRTEAAVQPLQPKPQAPSPTLDHGIVFIGGMWGL